MAFSAIARETQAVIFVLMQSLQRLHEGTIAICCDRGRTHILKLQLVSRLYINKGGARFSLIARPFGAGDQGGEFRCAPASQSFTSIPIIWALRYRLGAWPLRLCTRSNDQGGNSGAHLLRASPQFPSFGRYAYPCTTIPTWCMAWCYAYPCTRSGDQGGNSGAHLLRRASPQFPSFGHYDTDLVHGRYAYPCTRSGGPRWTGQVPRPVGDTLSRKRPRNPVTNRHLP